MKHIWSKKYFVGKVALFCIYANVFNLWFDRRQQDSPVCFHIQTVVTSLVMCSVTQMRLTLCGPTDCSLPGSSDCGISQARIVEPFCHFLIQGIFQTQGLSPPLLNRQADSSPPHHLGRLVTWHAVENPTAHSREDERERGSNVLGGITRKIALMPLKASLTTLGEPLVCREQTSVYKRTEGRKSRFPGVLFPTVNLSFFTARPKGRSKK